MNEIMEQTKPRGIMRRMYDWVLHWADTPYAEPALFVLAFTESSFFPIPPDVLLIALALSVPLKSLRYALICSIGSVFGGMFGYFIGYGLYESVGVPIVHFYGLEGKWDEVRQKYNEWGVWIVGVAAFTPIPYKVFTIAAGTFKMKFLPFVLVSFMGRSARFFIVAGLLRAFGAPAKDFIDKHFNWLSILFMALLILGFVVVKSLL